ncbi:hypothetical protein J4772_15565 [Cohnella sp. LGH]|uniref:hypothetical protein n=1 Tax=Cohnella sp. LGH TaxID=1619153 RepID=UPI001ADC277B|nr:hypothetical protein [Cohnella sp. LGH]QTH45708.1 hypothetical protein J4772_15565 [Cohnella sp. LGH]
MTSLEGFIDFDPDHLILLADGSDNILEQSGFWSKLQAVKAGCHDFIMQLPRQYDTVVGGQVSVFLSTRQITVLI